MNRFVYIWFFVYCVLGLASCSPGTEATEEANKALVNRFGTALNARQYEVIDELVADDFVRHCPATPGVNVRSRDQFIEYVKSDAATFPDSRQTIEKMIAEGDLVAFWATYEGTQDGPMGPFPPSHKKMVDKFAGMFRVRDGKLAELWVTWDNLAALTQLGHFPPVPSE